MLIKYYKQKSKYNNDTANYLSKANSPYYDWEIVTIFYSTLLLIDAYFIKDLNKRPSNHKERNSYVDIFLPGIKDKYKELFYMSITARYEPTNMSLQLRNKAYKLYNDISKYLYQYI
ncbi:MAG: hypothetical protein KatS3mg003_1842 [Candidatus Nitrosocaldaceae archaeon]|nr:MAG: hypothetical protein KatS3mg003_1842 [Candidatus Nitrosocaldaceae archaeon]